MVVPLLLAAIINTFSPNLLRNEGFTQALFVDSVPVQSAASAVTTAILIPIVLAILVKVNKIEDKSRTLEKEESMSEND